MMKVPDEIARLPLPDLCVVGGWVRDRLLCEEPGDIDLATSATPDAVTASLEANGYRVIPTGFEHGTVTVLLGDEPVEITTFRKDVATDGRHASVRFAGTIEEDLARRDFTMNAIALTRSGKIVDPFGGREDIAERRLLAVGNPGDRFREDFLRIVRAARFAARFDLTMSREVRRSGQALGSAVPESVSIERIVSETNKAFYQCARPSLFIETLMRFGVLEKVLPEIVVLRGMKQNPDYHPEGDALRHTMDVLDRARPTQENGWAVHRWNALFHDIGKGVTAERVTGEDYFSFHGHDAAGADMLPDLCDRLRLPSDLKEVLVEGAKLHMRPLYAQHQDAPVSDAQVRRFQSKVEHLSHLHALCIADAGDRRPDSIEALFADLPEPVEPVLMGRHLIDAGYAPGPKFGVMLRAAFEHQLETGTREIEALLRVAETAITDK